MNTGLLDPRDTVPRRRRVADVAPATVRQALANVRSAITQLQRVDDSPRLSDALIFLRNAEGKLDRLAGC